MRTFLLLLLLPAAAAAQETGLEGFSSPEDGRTPPFACWTLPTHPVFGNDALICTFYGQGVRLRPDWEARCEYASGPVFVLRPTGRARRECDERIGAGPNPRKLGPGDTWRRSGIRCENRAGTLDCTNRSGRGFRLDPRRQELF